MSSWPTKILVVGDAILDHYVYGSINRQSPEDQSISVVDVEKEEYRLGGCMNVAANIRSISFPHRYVPGKELMDVSLLSIFSKFTGQKLFVKGIRCDDACMFNEDAAGRIAPSKNEIIKTRVINQDTGKQLIRIDNRKRFSDDDIELYKNSFGDIDKYDAIVVSDYNKGLVNGFTLDKLIKFKGPVFVDTKNPNLAFWDDIENCFIKVNEKEWKASSKFTKHPVIQTMGEGGAILRHFLCRNFSTESVNNSDVIGAGDVFLAGLVVNYMRHKDLPFAIEFANMCAGISVKQQGTTEVRL